MPAMSATAESVSWQERARRLEFRTQAFIDGRYVDAASGATFDCVNPATGKLLASTAPSTRRAPHSAREAGHSLHRRSARECCCA